ncbi:hypothetical protein ACDA63_07115 [Uliginosibacterium sp. sgz301328]|uniref:hypothetical protein n=1 Tax=Uliginosibacterium sp. sgz301328 TaxID=3243764 RepID=UPI00359D60DD
MRYRRLDANGDYTFGTGGDFLRDSPETVAQAVRTRLDLWRGEWFVDTSDGTPWQTEVLGKNTAATYEAAIKRRIVGTEGVTQLVDFSSSYDGDTRRLTVTATIDTAYGQTTITETL